VVAETSPADEARPASSPNLEEAYLYCISSHRGAGDG
jgi:hypothetical protein